MKITFKNGEKRKYHIKTHSAGRLASNTVAAKSVDPMEWMVYKPLERLGFGCETHLCKEVWKMFILPNWMQAMVTMEVFIFEKATGSKGKTGDEIYGQSLWDVLQVINRDSTRNDSNAIETSIQSDKVAQNFLLQIASLDMLSRILRLKDLINNPNNFGHFVTSMDMPLLLVIDFRVVEHDYLKIGSEYNEHFPLHFIL